MSDGARRWAPYRTWTTNSLPGTEQFAAWREVVSEAFVPVSVTRDDAGPFMSTVAARAVGPLTVSRIASQPQRVHRRAEDIGGSPGDVFFLNLPLTPGARASQGGMSATLGPGDLVVVDATRPFELSFDRAFRQISVTLPQETLAPLLGSPGTATGVRVRGDQGVGAVAVAAVRTLAETAATIDPEAAGALADEIARLVALALRPTPARHPSAGRGLLLQAILDEVERSLDDPALTPARVADRVGVSVRYLHQLFADHGPSFSRWLLLRRLERCRRDLRDPLRAHWSIAAIAFDRGFRDPSHFSRAFRAHYGQTPREARRGSH